MVMYASVSRLELSTAQSAVDFVVSRPRIRNAANDITGALLFTGTHFVQVLEGPAGALDPLLVKLNADNRHESLIIMRLAPPTKRRFAGWDLAYSGPSEFVSKRVLRLFDEMDLAGKRHAARWLIDLMSQFANQ